MTTPLIRDNTLAKIVGWASFIGGAFLLHNAYEARGARSPWWSRPLTFW